MKYLIDTDWFIDARGGIAPAVRAIDELSSQGPGVSIISHGKLYDGAFAFADPRAQLAQIRRFLAAFEMLPLTDPIMEIFGQARFALRRTGQLIPDMDLLIAATAIHHDRTLLTRNLRHFTRIPELRLYQAF